MPAGGWAPTGGQITSQACGTASSAPRAPAKRWGDLLPLPLPHRPASPSASPSGGLSRTSRRRYDRELSFFSDCLETVLALNKLAGYGDSDHPVLPLNESQRNSLALIRELHLRRSWPKGSRLSPRAALSRTLRKPSSAYSSAEPAGVLSSYEPGTVSLPCDSDSSRCCRLVDSVSESTRELVEHFKVHMLKSPEEISALYDVTSTFADFYHDPAFTDELTWATFVKELFDAGILKFIKRAKLVNGVFFVSKKRAKGKPKRLRMIIDCRTANKFFKPPPRTVLGSV